MNTNTLESVKSPLNAPDTERCDQPPMQELYLFVCSGNTCRSPMAAALFNHFYGTDNRIAVSAGLYADGSPISRNAALALEQAGITPPEHISRSVSEVLIRQATQVIGITAAHADSLMWSCPHFASKITKLPVDIPDPFGGDLSVYQTCLDTIKSALLEMFGPPVRADGETC